MVEYTEIKISKFLKDELQKKATEKNTDIDNIIKLALVENTQLKKNPDKYMDTTKVSSKKNKGNSYSFSTAIPKPVLNKLGLTKGQILYWDIDDNKIIITPEVIPTPVPEEESIQAGYDIFQDMLFNGKTNIYTQPVKHIKKELEIPETEKSNEEKVNTLVELYKNHYRSRYTAGSVEENKRGFKQILDFLLDYPLGLPNQYEIVQEVKDQIIAYEKTLK